MANFINLQRKMKNLLIIIAILYTTILFGQTKQGKEPSDFLPEGYVIVERINGDLNKDRLVDCILIIKGTDKSKIIKDEYRGELERNRRGGLTPYFLDSFNKKV